MGTFTLTGRLLYLVTLGGRASTLIQRSIMQKMPNLSDDSGVLSSLKRSLECKLYSRLTSRSKQTKMDFGSNAEAVRYISNQGTGGLFLGLPSLFR